MNLSTLSDNVRRNLVAVLVLVLLLFADPSMLRIPAQTKDSRKAAAQRALDEGFALLQRTAESLNAAFGKFEIARNLFRETGDKRNEAESLLGLGRISQNLGNRISALQYYNQALPLWNAVDNKVGEAITLTNIGDVYSALDEKRRALEYYVQALLLWDAIGDKYGKSIALNHIGEVYSALGKKQEALEYFNQALLLADGLGQNAEGGVLGNIGSIYADLGKKEEALRYYKQALLLYRAVRNRHGEAKTLSDLGTVYLELGESQRALEYLNQALRLHRTVGDRDGEAITLSNIGGTYSTLGELEKALEYYNQALPLFRVVRNKSGEARTLNNIGGTYSMLGEQRRALEYYHEALVLFRELGDKSGQGGTLSNLGLIYSDLGDHQKALECLNQALSHLRAVGNAYGEASTLDSLGVVYSALGQNEKALEYCNEALRLFRASRSRYGEAMTLNNLGEIYADLGQLQKAFEYLNQALPLRRAVGDRDGEATTLNNLMWKWRTLDNPQLAVFFGKQAVNRYQDLRRAVRGLDKGTQKIYLQTMAGTYRGLAELLIEQGRLPEAQLVLGLLKEEEYFEFVRRDKDEIAALARSVELNEVERKAFAEYARLADELTAIGAKYQTLFDRRNQLDGKPLPDAAEEVEFQKLSQQLAATSDTFQKFLDSLAGEFARANPVNNFKIARIQELQADLREVGPDVVLVSTFVLPDRYRVILIAGQTQVDRKFEIKEGDLNRKLACFLMALKNPRVDPRPLGKELYDILVKPLEQDLAKGKFKTILWSLDGALRYIPVAALWDGQHYLAERYQNANITLGRNSRLFREVNRDWRALGAGVSAKWPGFTELSAVKGELRSIIRDERLATETEGVIPGRRLLDGEFVASRLKDLLPSREAGRRFNLVHLASHFKLSQTRDSSFLLLGDGSELSLTEFDKDPRLKLNGVELLTLSACETGVGIDKGDGSEVESLGMLAEKNGAKAVMATLWEVADCSTGEFMREFYRFYQQAQQQGTTKATALQRAQQAMLSGAIQAPAECQARKGDGGTKPDVCAMPPYSPNPAKPFAHPYYWAPFVLFGNWR